MTEHNIQKTLENQRDDTMTKLQVGWSYPIRIDSKHRATYRIFKRPPYYLYATK